MRTKGEDCVNRRRSSHQVDVSAALVTYALYQALRSSSILVTTATGRAREPTWTPCGLSLPERWRLVPAADQQSLFPQTAAMRRA
jgi:hypothetical protein